MHMASELHGSLRVNFDPVTFLIISRNRYRIAWWYRRPAYLGIILLLIFKFLIWNHWHAAAPKVHSDGKTCLDRSLREFSASIHHGDASIFYHGQFSQRAFSPFVGNGLVGVSLDEDGIYLARNRSYDRHVPFSILLSFAAEGQTLSPSVTVIDFREAIAYRIFVPQASEEDLCWWIRQTVFVQRSASDVIVQEILVANEGDLDVKVGLSNNQRYRWRSADVQTKSFSQPDVRIGDSSTYTVRTGPLDTSQEDTAHLKDTTLVAVASVQASTAELAVKAGTRSNLVQLVTVVVSQEVPLRRNSTVFNMSLRRLGKQAGSRLLEIIHRPSTSVLLQEHRMSWSELWQSRISIMSLSHPNTPSNEEISAASYYLFSSSSSFSTIQSSHYRHRGHVHRDLSDSERLNCFSGPSTMHTASLWQAVSSVSEINSLVRQWIDVLSRYGCKHYVNEGAELTGRAVVLSFAGLRHAKRHLELAVNPANVFADVVLHNINYDRHAVTLSLHTSFTGGLTRLSVSTSHRQAFLPGASAQNRLTKTATLYACPSRCSGTPHVLNSHETVLPVIVTNPATPVLYISSSPSDLTELQTTLASVDSSHVAVHRPISSLRHLKHQSVVVWVGIGLFILVFHVFVIVMLVVECRGQKDLDDDMDINSFLFRRRMLNLKKNMMGSTI